MPISSFYGMQTSLRGLIAQQRMIDTTGHNIANASTVGYSRQEATLGLAALRCRSRRTRRAGAPSAPASTSKASAASATSSWTSSTAARTRASATGRPGPRRSTAPSWPSRSPATTASTPSWRSSGTRGPTSRRRPTARRQRRSSRRPARSRTRSTRSARRWSPRGNRRASTPPSPAPAARSTRSPPSSPSLNKTICRSWQRDRRTTSWTAATCCSTSSPASARSPSAPRGRLAQRLLRRPHDRHHLPDRRRPTASWGGPPAGGWGPGGKMGGLLTVAPGRRDDRRLPRPRSIPSRRRSRLGQRPPTAAPASSRTRRPPAGRSGSRLTCRPRRATSPPVPAPRAPTTSRSRSRS